MGFRICDRDTDFPMPPSIQDWVPADHVVRFIVLMAAQVPLPQFQFNRRRTGSEQYHPHMMLALLVYCYSAGIFSSRAIERATYTDVAVRFAAGNSHPDHATIAKFRRENKAAIAEAFLRGLQTARAVGMLRLNTVAVDGTKIEADAGDDPDVPRDDTVPAVLAEEQSRRDTVQQPYQKFQDDARAEAAKAQARRLAEERTAGGDTPPAQRRPVRRRADSDQFPPPSPTAVRPHFRSGHPADDPAAIPLRMGGCLHCREQAVRG